jgi:hypothetical protein
MASDRRRRRSWPVITSTRATAPSLALVQALFFAPVLPDGIQPRLDARRLSADKSLHRAVHALGHFGIT